MGKVLEFKPTSKEKPTYTDYFSETIARNEANKKRIEKERLEHNKKTIKSHRVGGKS